MTGAIAAILAYLADTSNENNRCVRRNEELSEYQSHFFRSRIFSLNLSLLHIGMALGPSIGSLLIRFTGQVLSVFYLAGSLHLLYSCLVWFIMPESLTQGYMELAKTRYADGLRTASPDSSNSFGFITNAQRLFFFLRPLAILKPTGEVNRNALKGRRKDWNLTLLAVAYGGFTVAVLVSVLIFIFTKF